MSGGQIFKYHLIMISVGSIKAKLLVNRLSFIDSSIINLLSLITKASCMCGIIINLNSDKMKN